MQPAAELILDRPRLGEHPQAAFRPLGLTETVRIRTGIYRSPRPIPDYALQLRQLAALDAQIVNLSL